MSRVRLGDMLIASQMASEEAVEQALAVQRERGGKLGEVLIELGIVTEVQLAQVLSNQLSIPWVNLYHVEFSRELLNLIPAEIAEKYSVVPVYIRKVRNTGETLFVAMDDPTNEEALIELAQLAKMPVRPMVASSGDVGNAIRVYYLGGKTQKRSSRPAKRAGSVTPKAGTIPPVEIEDLDIEVDAPKPEELKVPKAAPVPRSSPSSSPSSRAPAKKKAKMITLTLLDGTTVTLPGGKREASTENLTTRDLIQALLARAQGKDVSNILPDGKWEPLVATILSLLLRKGLIADWEFVEEWSKHRG